MNFKQRKRSTRGRRVVGAIAGATAVVVLAACGAGGSGGSNGGDGESAANDGQASNVKENQITDLVVDSLNEPDSLDPFFRATPEAQRIYRLLYSSLMQWNEDGTLSPDLAAEPPQSSEDGLTWTVKLQEGVTFHDGSALTSSDVVHTVNEALELENGSFWRNGLLSVESVEVVDELTVKFELSEPFAYFESKLAMLPILSEGDDYAVNDTYATTENGSGPYSLKELNTGDSIVLERFADYYGEPYAFETVTFKVVPEDSSRIARLTSGETHIVPELPVDQLDQVKSRGANATIVEENVSRLFAYTSLNADRPTASVDYRLALAYAIDRGRIVDQVYNGAARPNSTYLSYGALFHDEEVGLAFGESPDLEKARAYLDASGADVNRPLEIIAQKAPHVSNAATIIQANLKELGIESNVDVRDLAGFYENLVTAEYDVILYQSPSSSSAGFSPDYVVGGLHSESPTNFGQCNDPKMDEVLDAAVVAITEEEQAAAWKAVQEYDVETQCGNLQIVSAQYSEGWSQDLGEGYQPSRLLWFNTLRDVN